MTRINSLTGKEIVTCVICEGDIDHHIDPSTGECYWILGHNAAPVKNGRCCDTCNATAVMTARLKPMFGDRASDMAVGLASARRINLDVLKELLKEEEE